MWEDKGFLQDDLADVTSAMQQLKSLMLTVRERFEKMDASKLLAAPAPGKWSKQQVLGHLIDSAINNVKRFTEAQFLEQPCPIIPYQQNKLMEVNHYQDLPIGHLLTLWQSLNQQILFIVEKMPAERLLYSVQPQYNQTGTQTLAWLICDYVAHMQHHLKSIT